jgi:predicted membrane chloride channel (bestrophin family)
LVIEGSPSGTQTVGFPDLESPSLKTIRTFLTIIDAHTVVVTLLALVSTYLALSLELWADMPADIISVAVIFPIVFSIHAAYNRREESLRYLASLRSHANGLYFAHRDWVRSGSPGDHEARARESLGSCLSAVRRHLRSSATNHEVSAAAVHGHFSELSLSLERLRDDGVNGSELGRANQYLRAMMMDFELLRNIASYRTPVPLRAYSRVFLNTFPILFGPYFASLSRDYYASMGYAVAALYSLVLVSLDNIQERLENPFDADGMDDVRLDELVIADVLPVPPGEVPPNRRGGVASTRGQPVEGAGVSATA